METRRDTSAAQWRRRGKQRSKKRLSVQASGRGRCSPSPHLGAGEDVEEAVCGQQHVEVAGAERQRVDVGHGDDGLLLRRQAAGLWGGAQGRVRAGQAGAGAEWVGWG